MGERAHDGSFLGEFVGLEVAAEYLGLSPRTVRAMAARGDVPVYCVGPRGGRLKFKLTELRDYIESRRRDVRPIEPERYRARLMGRLDGLPARHV